jgi:hypothetical protein
MGQLIHLPIRSPAHPDRSADLDTAECVLLMSIRWWVADRKARVDPLLRLCQALGNAGASDAAFSVDRLMEVIARHPRRQIEIHCPRCAAVSDDEKHLLHIASLAQLGDRVLAERLLRMTLVTGRGAEFAVFSLEDLGEMFAEVGLFLHRRSPPAAGGVEPWVPASFSETVH